MKIAVLLATMKRPQLAASVLMSLWNLSGDKNEITYNIGIELWDKDTEEALKAIPIPNLNIFHVPDTCLTHGQILNWLCSLSDAEVYMSVVDDNTPMSRYWDEKVVAYFSAGIRHRQALSWWAEEELGDKCGTPCVTREWLNRVGYMCPPHFPFWFVDTWLEEVYQFAFNRKFETAHWLPCHGRRGSTHNFRDLDFWWGFFNATRKIRLQEGYAMSGEAISLDDFMESRIGYIAHAVEHDRNCKNRIMAIQGGRVDKSEPTEKYLKAKANAEEFLKQHGLTLWSCIG